MRTNSRAAFDEARRRHAAAETRRREQLAERREAYQAASAEAISQAREYNEGIDMFARDFRASDSEDDGIDAVAVSEAPVFGGVCVIQAKRSRQAVGIDVVRALAGTMEDVHATKGVVVTTSWVTKDGHAFATRHGRIEIMECDHLKYLCKEHLGLDVLVSLPKPPPGRS